MDSDWVSEIRQRLITERDEARIAAEIASIRQKEVEDRVANARYDEARAAHPNYIADLEELKQEIKRSLMQLHGSQFCWVLLRASSIIVGVAPETNRMSPMFPFISMSEVTLATPLTDRVQHVLLHDVMLWGKAVGLKVSTPTVVLASSQRIEVPFKLGSIFRSRGVLAQLTIQDMTFGVCVPLEK